jgi:hypothetical protein
MKARLANLLLLVLVLTTGSCRAREPLLIIADGRSQYQIVIPDKAGPHERKAASVLQQYLQRMSGVTLAVVAEKSYQGQTGIFIGKTEHGPGGIVARLRHDGFCIVTGTKDVFIRGASGKGSLYGVYAFLEAYLGCRKYAGGEPAVVPAKKTVSVPAGIEDLQNPQFVYRQTYYPASEDEEYLDWHKLHRFEDLWGLWGHSFFKIIPPEAHFPNHPEYFSLIQGKRRPVQLCLSNEGVFQLTVAYLRDAIAAHPDAIYWSLSPNDEPLYCTCAACSRADAEEGGPQGSLIRFVNRVAKVFPEQKFTTLAYGHTARPPAKTRPAPNVYVFLSSIDAYRSQPLAEEPSAAAFRKNLDGWSALTDRLFIWDYTTQFTNYLTPFPVYMNTAADIRFLAAKNVVGVFLHGSEHTYSDMAEWNSYLQAKLLWDPAADARAVQQDFMSGYYGAAGGHMTHYTDTLQEIVRNIGVQLDIYGNPVNNYRDYLSPEHIDRYSAILDRAEAAVEGQVRLEARVAKARLPLEYVVLQQSTFFGAQPHGYLEENEEGTGYMVRSRWPERVRRFVEQCVAAGVTELSEGGISPQKYLAAWQERFAHLPKRNMAADATVHLAHPYAPEYPARGEQTLTDGLPGEADYSSGWLLFYGADMVATLDLHQSRKLSAVTAGFLSDPRHYIFIPLSIRVEVSDDGSRYREVGARQVPAIEEDFTVAPRKFSFPLPAGTQARFVRVSAACPTQLPAWRYHERKKPALACDEIMVE